MARYRWWLALLLALPVLAGAEGAQPPAHWAEAARSLGVQAQGRTMALETWTNHAVEPFLLRAIGPEPDLLTSLPVFPVEGQMLSAAQVAGLAHRSEALTRQYALLVYWVDQSRAGQWDEATKAMEVLVRDTAAARGGPDGAALEVFHNGVPWVALVGILGALGLALGLWFRRGPAWLVPATATLAWVVVTLWLVVRILITGRPPVTALPSTFLFVAWLLLATAAGLALRPHQRTGSLLALGAGSVLPVVAALVQGPTDPFAPVQAVLNTNFWLAVHVPVVVAGYAGAFVAGLVAHGYLWAAGGKKGGGDLTALWKNLRVALVVGLGLTVAGTLLGGVWADQSWGRFWGWDPKENGALLLILWLALTLHLKPAGLTQEWGTAVAAALVLPVLLFSWLGVNLLGLGFHSYGAAPDKVVLFLGLLAADLLVLSFLLLRKTLR